MAGFAISVISLLVAIGYLVAKLMFWDELQLGLAPLLIGIYFFGAVQLFFIGVLGEYIGSIPPKFISGRWWLKKNGSISIARSPTTARRSTSESARSASHGVPGDSSHLSWGSRTAPSRHSADTVASVVKSWLPPVCALALSKQAKLCRRPQSIRLQSPVWRKRLCMYSSQPPAIKRRRLMNRRTFAFHIDLYQRRSAATGSPTPATLEPD